jgi:hypothetical protein
MRYEHCVNDPTTLSQVHLSELSRRHEVLRLAISPNGGLGCGMCIETAKWRRLVIVIGIGLSFAIACFVWCLTPSDPTRRLFIAAACMHAAFLFIGPVIVFKESNGFKCKMLLGDWALLLLAPCYLLVFFSFYSGFIVSGGVFMLWVMIAWGICSTPLILARQGTLIHNSSWSSRVGNLVAVYNAIAIMTVDLCFVGFL